MSAQHVSFVYREGHSTLQPLSTFSLKLPNNFSLCHVPATVVKSIHWWSAILSSPGGSQSLAPHHKVDPDIWVDTSTSWGIGLVVSDHWAVWHLCDGWKCADRDIGWVESVALEVVVMWLVWQDFT